MVFPGVRAAVIAGVITGVGLLGAGPIFREPDMTGHGQVLGLTTAASSWAAAALGILAGAGLYPSAGVGCAIVLAILELNRLPSAAGSSQQGPPRRGDRRVRPAAPDDLLPCDGPRRGPSRTED